MEFDTLVHQPTRLQLFAYLYRHGEASFTELGDALGLTEGNLASHLDTMAEAGAVASRTEVVDGSPRTTYELTEDGREAFEEHISTLEALIDDLEEG